MAGKTIDDGSESSSRIRTLVLVGRMGNGKSATGNNILGRRAFKSLAGFSGVTSGCELQKTTLNDGRILQVIDTPGPFSISAEPVLMGKEIFKCFNMAKDGIHAILLVFSVRSRFSKEEAAVVEGLMKLFGSKVNEYIVVVFTGGDELEEREESLEDYFGEKCPEAFKELLKMCGNRTVLFDNRTKDEAKKLRQLEQLLAVVEGVVETNGGRPYTSELFVEHHLSAMATGVIIKEVFGDFWYGFLKSIRNKRTRESSEED